MASLWNDYYTEEELAKARAMADEFGGMNNMRPIADKKVVANNTIVNAPVETGEFAGIQPQAPYNPMYNKNEKYGYLNGKRTVLPKQAPKKDELDGLLAQADADRIAMEKGPQASLMDNPYAEKMKKPGFMSSLWENIQNPEWWTKEVEGGAGSWDNRLFRLGEMMAYMGTPLAQRGKNPASRWTTAATEADKIKAAIEKERIKAAGKGTDIFSKVGNKQLESSIKRDIFEKMGGDQWLALDPNDEELNQQVSEAAIAIQTLMKSGMSFADAKQAVLDAIE